MWTFFEIFFENLCLSSALKLILKNYPHPWHRLKRSQRLARSFLLWYSRRCFEGGERLVFTLNTCFPRVSLSDWRENLFSPRNHGSILRAIDGERGHRRHQLFGARRVLPAENARDRETRVSWIGGGGRREFAINAIIVGFRCSRWTETYTVARTYMIFFVIASTIQKTIA